MPNDPKMPDLLQAARCEDLNYQQIRTLSVLVTSGTPFRL
ncbi:MAG: hypothetical protein SRB2_02045 [Desulfobacteraceae bacterium Eth-SRB2]|nr:MAG: hypothetical protein SRB2_02045 [Desulfobacteraceae bacterium Eth-SRB2]